jgi:hypothetical protein
MKSKILATSIMMVSIVALSAPPIMPLALADATLELSNLTSVFASTSPETKPV